MKMTKEQFMDKLKEEALKQSIELPKETLEKMYEYKELLVEWNDKINLTTIIEDYDVIIKHIVDSLIVTKYIKEGQSVIDVGTGAGLPGIIIAIYFEGNVKVTLMDSANKKITFLNDVISKLNLKNVQTINGRAEEVCHKKQYREGYDIAIARAVAKINVLAELLSGYIKIGGNCIFMKAGSVEEELNEASGALSQMQLELEKEDKYNIKYMEETLSRTIVVAKKTEKLEEDYPRIYGKIKNSPF